jgi:CheY-like chemotaxis protein
MQMMLEQFGYEVITATNGREAIERVIDVQPDLVLLDIMMPEVDGMAVCRHIKDNDLLKRIKVILYTAKDKPRSEEMSQKVGADAFLAKPFETEVLRKLIEKLLKQQVEESSTLAKKVNR